ncbi:MAG: polysaccharide deacetylase family protein [Syntrophobacteraceae bacterium]
MASFRQLFFIAMFSCAFAISFFGPDTAAPQGTALPAPHPSGTGSSIRGVRVAGGQKLLALTFDLCEGPRETSGFDRDLVDFLEANSVKATFFAGGKWMRSHPEQTMRLMLDPLFEIGNHSWSHANFRLLGPGEAREEVVRAQEQYLALRETLVRRLEARGAGADTAARVQPSMRLFRFPYGACTAESLALLAELEMPAIQWDIVSGDASRGRSAAAIVSTVLPRAKPGSIIIFHANGKGSGTLGALRELVPKLRGRGFEFATVGELLASGDPVGVPECYELHPGDNLRYDRLSRPSKRRPVH